MKLWFTADHHFGHANIIKFCNRPFSDVNEMDEIMILRWNEVVEPGDEVYYLGDFTLGDYNMFLSYRLRLNGVIKFVPGGHDYRWFYEAEREGHKTRLPLQNIELPAPNMDKLIFVLCHYSMRVWDRSHYGSFHLYGHSHGRLPGLGRSMDVGVDTNNFYPYSLEEVIKKLSKIEPHNAPEKGEK